MEFGDGLGIRADPFHRHSFDLLESRDLILDGKLGVIAAVAFPQAANRTLAFVHYFIVCCAAMLMATNNFALGACAFRVSGLHVITLAQLLAQCQCQTGIQTASH